jgi:carbamoyltransferase
MLETCAVVSPLRLPAITHINGSARLQTVDKKNGGLYADLIEAFDRLTGCPILLNTSFNIRGQPIVCTPEDALATFITTDIDCLVLGDFLLDRADNSLDLLQAMVKSQLSVQSKISHDVYTFI